MFWQRTRDRLAAPIAEAMAAGGFEARPEWSSTQGVIKCGAPGEAYWHFEVHLRASGDGWTTVGIKRIDDAMRDGVPWDTRKRCRIEARSFDIHETDERKPERMLREVRAHVEYWVGVHQASKDREWDEIHGPAQAVASISEKLQELIDRDPQGAGEAIAELLGKKFDKDEIRALQAVVEEANAEAFSPR